MERGGENMRRRRAEARFRERGHSRYGEETSVGIGCAIRKLWKGVMKI